MQPGYVQQLRAEYKTQRLQDQNASTAAVEWEETGLSTAAKRQALIPTGSSQNAPQTSAQQPKQRKRWQVDDKTLPFLQPNSRSSSSKVLRAQDTNVQLPALVSKPSRPIGGTKRNASQLLQPASPEPLGRLARGGVISQASRGLLDKPPPALGKPKDSSGYLNNHPSNDRILSKWKTSRAAFFAPLPTIGTQGNSSAAKPSNTLSKQPGTATTQLAQALAAFSADDDDDICGDGGVWDITSRPYDNLHPAYLTSRPRGSRRPRFRAGKENVGESYSWHGSSDHSVSDGYGSDGMYGNLLASDQHVMKTSPRVAFTRAGRWPEPTQQASRSPSLALRTPALGVPSAPKPSVSPPLNLEPGYLAITTRAREVQFSKCPRFHSPAARPRPRCSPGGVAVRTHSSSSAEGCVQATVPHKPQQETAGVEAALDFVKASHVPAVSIAPPSVKEQVAAVLAARKAAREEQQGAARKLLKAAKVAAAGASAAEDAIGLSSTSLLLGADVGDGMQPIVASTALRTLDQPVQGSAQSPRSPALFNSRPMTSASMEFSLTAAHRSFSQPLRCSLSVQSMKPSILNPQYTLVERTPRTTRFPSPPRPKSTGRIFSREPGPTTYTHLEETTLVMALSTATRAPTTVFGTAPRDVTSPRHNPAAVMAQRQRQPLAALDMILPRAPVAVISTAGITHDRTGTQKPLETVVETDGDAHVAPQILHISYSLVEPRVRRAPIMAGASVEAERARAHAQEDAATHQLLLASQLAIDPWQLDAAIRVRKPAWAIPLAVVMVQRPVPPPQLLYPNWQKLKPRADVGIPLFARFLNTHRALDKAGDRRRAAQMPAVGQYDLQEAWVFLQKHVPQVVMQLAESRWRISLADGLSRGGDQVVLELSVILDTVRGVRAPAWTFRPLPSQASRQASRRSKMGKGYGPMLSWDADQALDNVLVRRGIGTLTWAEPPDVTYDEARARELMHVAPGAYDIRYGQVERRVLGRRFSTYLGHDIFSSSDDEGSDDGSDSDASLPEGARLQLDVLAARDALRRRRQQFVQMDGMQGRDVGILGAGDPFGAYTADLEPLDGDGDRVLSYRPRAPQVVISSAADAAEGPKSPGAKAAQAADARRGPGAYDPTLDAVTAAARAADFARGPGHTVHTCAPEQALEGQRLSLEVDIGAIRPRPPAHLIPPLPTHHAVQLPGALPQDLYKDAQYDLDLKAVRPQPPRPLDWSLQPAVRGDGSPARKQPISPPRDYHVEDIPLHVLAGYGAPKAVLDWSRMAPTPNTHTTGDLPVLEGDRLELDAAAAFRALHDKQGLGLPNMSKQQGRPEPEPSDEPGAWVSYAPQFSLVRPRPASPPAFELGTGRARHASPPPTTLDIDGGVYNVTHAQLWPNPRTVTSWSVAGPRFSPSRDQDSGNVLDLHPEMPKGWQRPGGTEPDAQPFGMSEARWSAPGVVPDSGNVLRLRTDADDLAAPRRPTLANTPAAVFGAMTASRYEQVIKPNENVAVRQVYRPPEGQRIETSLMTQLPSNKALELIRHDPGNPVALAVQRRERVWARIERRIAEQYGSAAMGVAAAEPGDGPSNPAHLGPCQPGVLQGVLPHLAARPSAVGRKEWVVKQELVPKGPRDHAAIRQIHHEDAKQARDNAKAYAKEHKAPARPRNLDGAFYVAHNPKAPPAQPPPAFVHKGGLFHEVQGGSSMVQEAYPSLLVNRGRMDAQRMAGVMKAAQAAADGASPQPPPQPPLQIRLPPIKESVQRSGHGNLKGDGGVTGLRQIRGGMTYESEPDRPSTQQLQAAVRPPPVQELGALRHQGREAARRLERLRRLAQR